MRYLHGEAVRDGHVPDVHDREAEPRYGRYAPGQQQPDHLDGGRPLRAAADRARGPGRRRPVPAGCLRPELSRHRLEADAAGAPAIELLTETVRDCQREGSAPSGDPGPLVAMVWALAIGIVTLWLDGPLEDRCVSLGTTPEGLTAQITALLANLLTGDG